MSKHRPLTAFERRLLESPECLLWPECACYQNIVKWQQALADESRTFDKEQLEYADDILFYTCACVAAHCPDPEIKAFGERQFARLTARRERIALQVVEPRQCL